MHSEEGLCSQRHIRRISMISFQRKQGHRDFTFLRIVTFSLSFLTLIHTVTGCSAYQVTNEVKTVDSVDFSAYKGKWYELYRLPNSFQDEAKVLSQRKYNKRFNTSERVSREVRTFDRCLNTTAEYSEGVGSDKGKILVKNTCYRFNSRKQEIVDIAKANARAEKNSYNAKLKVNFTGITLLEWLGIGDGRYWIIGLGPINAQNQYSWAMVAGPDRKFAWILSRTKELAYNDLEYIFSQFEQQGFSRKDFVSTRVNAAESQ